MVGKRGTSRTTRCPDDHKHAATGTCYNCHGCGCDECVAGNTRRTNARRRLRAYGRAKEYRVDKTEAAVRVRALRDAGWTVQGIADEAAVPRSAVDALFNDRYARTTLTTATAILAVPVQPPNELKWKRVTSLGTRRRIESLAYMGWSIRDLEREGRFGDGHLSETVRSGGFIHESTANRIAELYDRLWNQPPPCSTSFERGVATRTRAMARRRGWVGPLHWDSIDTDPEPATILPDTDRAGWVIDELDMLREAGESAVSAAALLRRNVKSTASLAFRHGRPDLGRWLEEAA